jgi:hypothetical protein
MAGALYTGVHLDEDWLRAALYLIVFVTLALIGPGKFSVDHLIKSKTPAPRRHISPLAELPRCLDVSSFYRFAERRETVLCRSSSGHRLRLLGPMDKFRSSSARHLAC